MKTWPTFDKSQFATIDGSKVMVPKVSFWPFWPFWDFFDPLRPWDPNKNFSKIEECHFLICSKLQLHATFQIISMKSRGEKSVRTKGWIKGRTDRPQNNSPPPRKVGGLKSINFQSLGYPEPKAIMKCKKTPKLENCDIGSPKMGISEETQICVVCKKCQISC